MNVTITDRHHRARGLLVPAEIISGKSGDVVSEVGLEVGRTTEVDVEPDESYTVRARFPSGRFVAVQNEGRADVSIPVPLSAHEFLEYQTATGAVPAVDRYVPPLRPTANEPWVQLWTTQPRPWPAGGSDTDGTSWVLTIRERLPSGMHYLVTGSSAAACRVTVLPVEAQPSITIRTKGPGTGGRGGIDVTVSAADPSDSRDANETRAAESVLLHLHSGRVETATLLAAQRLLFQKITNPTGAAIGGYYLLMAGDFERMHNWPGNFESWKDYLPDAAIIHGLRCLWEPDDSKRDLRSASQSLVRASLLGPPVFTIGLRLLRQGLELLNRHLTDPALDGALRLVNSYGNAADADKPYTTFLARNPLEPLAHPVTGVPFDRTHLYWLSSLTLGWSPFPPENTATPSTAQRNNVFVEPVGARGWQVAWTTASGAESERFDAKRTAITFARRKALESAPSRLVIYKGDLSTNRVNTFNKRIPHATPFAATVEAENEPDNPSPPHGLTRRELTALSPPAKGHTYREIGAETAALPGLTPREREILAHVGAGRTNGEIAVELMLSVKTVKVHVSRLLHKIGAANRFELAQLARRVATSATD